MGVTRCALHAHNMMAHNQSYTCRYTPPIHRYQEQGTHGACEIVTGGHDGCVRVWDPRCGDGPVAALHPASDAHRRDCWAVCFGNAHNAHDRCIAAGYEQGDVKLFDLRANRLQWECCVGRGVCALQVCGWCVDGVYVSCCHCMR